MRRGLERIGRSVFKNVSKLGPYYVPKDFVDREEEFRKLVRFFRPLLEGGASQKVLIHGPSGSGKTSLALRFGQILESAAKGRSFRLKCVYIDCREQRTPYLIARRLASCYGFNLPRRGYPTQYCFEKIVERLSMERSYLVLIVDWLDLHIRQYGSELPYLLCRQWNGQEGPNRISLISISHDPRLLDLLDGATQSTFLHNRVELGGYSARQLKEILLDRVEVAFVRGAVSEETVGLISKVASERGDAGLAIRLLRCAGEIADEEGAREVTPEHAERAKPLVHPKVWEEDLETLRGHERLLLTALIRRLKSSDRAFVLTGELLEEYRSLSEERGESPVSCKQVRKLVRWMSGLGLIEASPFRGDHKGLSKRIRIPQWAT